MKGLVKILLLLSILSMFVSETAYAEGSRLSIRVDKAYALLEENITVEIIAQDITHIVGADLRINYDPARLQLISKQILMDEGAFIDIQQLHTDLEDTQGTAKILFGLKKIPEPITSAETVLATLTFKAMDVGQAHVAFMPDSRLIQEMSSEGTVDYRYISPQLPSNDTIISIMKNAKIDGTLSCSDAYDPTNATVKLFKDGEEKEKVTLDATGNYTFSNIPDGDYQIIVEKPGYTTFEQSFTIQDGQDIHLDILLIRIKEDADRDGSTDLNDVAFIAGKIGQQLTDTNKDVDVNEDGAINMLDVVHITRQLE